MTKWTPFLWLLAATACDNSSAAVASPGSESAVATAVAGAPARVSSASPRPPSSASAAVPSAPESECSAPSLLASDPFDVRLDSALDRCGAASTGAAERANRCGQEPTTPPLDLARLDEALPRWDPATSRHLREVAARGRSLGRRPRVFGLVGDSMTVSGAFMRPLASADTTRLAPEVEASLQTPLLPQGGTIIDYYRGVEVQRVRGLWRDSFGATRAARVGARAPWALMGGAQSPVGTMLAELKPAIAVVLFGGNDAAWRSASLNEIGDVFARDLERIVDVLEEAGVVVLLNTVARHGNTPGYDDCGRRSELSDWRIAVQTNALSARVVEIACRRKLPLLDLRHALDAAEGRGIGSDGIHPSSFHEGAGVLTARGLRCGYNVRNYVTLKALAQLAEVIGQD